MTLVAHIIYKDYQVVAADGRIIGPTPPEEHFDKVVAYPNGFLYLLNEIACPGDGNLFDWITAELPQRRQIRSVKAIIDPAGMC